VKRREALRFKLTAVGIRYIIWRELRGRLWRIMKISYWLEYGWLSKKTVSLNSTCLNGLSSPPLEQMTQNF